MPTTQINRRKALTVVAAAPAVVALPVALAVEGPSELAALVSRYFAEVDEFNRIHNERDVTDEEGDALAGAMQDATIKRIIDTPARSREDALAALEFLEREEMIDEWGGPGEGLSESLVDAIRGYIEQT